MKNLFLVTTLCVQFMVLQAQPQLRLLPYRPFESMNFAGFNPDWYSVNFDPSIVSDSCDGYNYFNIPYNLMDIIDGDAFYTIDLKGAVWDVFGGTYVSKKSLVTGALIWRKTYGLSDTSRQEVAVTSYLNEDGNLEVIGMLKTTPYIRLNNIPIQSNPRMILTKRIFDAENGDLLYYNNPDYNDPSLERVRFSYFGRSNPLFREGKDKIRKFDGIYLDTIDYKKAYVSTLLDPSNKFSVISRDTLPVVYKAINYGDIVMTDLPSRIGENEYLFTEKILENGAYKVFLRYTDSELNILGEYLSDVINQEVNFLSLRRVSDDKTKLLFTNNVNIFDPSGERRYDILITDRQGRVLNQARIDTKYDINYDVIEWNEDNSLKLMATTYYLVTENSLYHQLEVLGIDAQGKVEIEKSYVSTDSLRSIITPIVTKMPNNKYLVRFRESTVYKMPPYGSIVPDYYSKAISHMLVDGSYFGISTGTSNVIVEDPIRIEISPTIATDRIHIAINQPYSGSILIRSLDGRIHYQATLVKAKEEEIQIDQLENGIYFITFSDKSNQNGITTLKFIKM